MHYGQYKKIAEDNYVDLLRSVYFIAWYIKKKKLNHEYRNVEYKVTK